MNQLVCSNCGSIHTYDGERIHWLHSFWDMCPSCRAKRYEQITSLQARNKSMLEAIDEMKFFLGTIINSKSQYSYQVGDDGFRLMANGKHHAKDLLNRLENNFGEAIKKAEG